MQIVYPYPPATVAIATSPLRMALPWQSLCITGNDAQSFLQGQVTCDLRRVTATQGSLGALLNLKGRIMSSFIVISMENGYRLLMPQDQLAIAQARLHKYAVFSKVSLHTDNTPVIGLHQHLDIAADLPTTPYSVSVVGDQTLIRLAGDERALLLGAEAVSASAVEWQQWQALAYQAGEFIVPAAASEQWQPQELNYHLLQGVSYEKGCYLGQEIVARLYFRGQLKTALRVLELPWAGQHDADTDWPLLYGEQKVGDVVTVCWPTADTACLLALMRQDVSDCHWQTPYGQLPSTVRSTSVIDHPKGA